MPNRIALNGSNGAKRYDIAPFSNASRMRIDGSFPHGVVYRFHQVVSEMVEIARLKYDSPPCGNEATEPRE